MSQLPEQIYLLTIFGTRAQGLEAMRPIHNRVAGAPEDVAAAKSLSDLSHMVYTSVDEQSPAFVIMDLWTDLGGFNQFFTEPERHKKQGTSGLFTQQEPVLWEPAEGFFTYHLPAPTGRYDRFFGLLRGSVYSREQAQRLVNQVRRADLHKARAAGHLSHEVYFRLARPGAPESLVCLTVDGCSIGRACCATTRNWMLARLWRVSSRLPRRPGCCNTQPVNGSSGNEAVQ